MSTTNGLLKLQQPKIAKDSFTAKCCRKLVNAIKSKVDRKERINFKKWCDEFVKLEKKYPADVITKVLDWYTTNITKEYVPEAYSAQSFRKKFEQIKKQADDVIVPVSDISPKAQKLLNKIKHWSWRGMDRHLPKAVSISLERYEAFLKRMQSFPNQCKERAAQDDKNKNRLLRLSRIAEFLVRSAKLSTPFTFLSNWFEYFATIISKGYEVSAARMIWGLDNPSFSKFMYEAVYDYTNKSADWDMILKELRDESKKEQSESTR